MKKKLSRPKRTVGWCQNNDLRVATMRHSRGTPDKSTSVAANNDPNDEEEWMHWINWECVVD